MSHHLSIHPIGRFNKIPQMDFTDDNGNDYLETDKFYKHQLKNFETNNLTKTWIVCDEDRDDMPVGYFSLAMATIRVRDKLYPAMEIVQFGVDKKERGEGIGKEIAIIVIGMATELSIERVGCRYVGIESQMNMLGFFEQCYFQNYENTTGRTKIWLYYRIPNK